MTHRSSDEKTEQLVYTALMICLILLGTVLFRIPVPMTQGYVHLGDAMVYLGVLTLGKKNGAAAAGLGSALADVLGGYAFWAPYTFLLKFLMAFIAGAAIEISREHGGGKEASRSPVTAAAAAGMAAGGIFMTAGYCISERFMYGSWGAAFLGVPWNIGQFAAGIVLSIAAYTALRK